MIIYFYIYPDKPREATNYTLHFYFNSLLFLDIVIKVPLSIFLLFSLIYKRSRIILYCGLIISLGSGIGLLYGLVKGNNDLKVNQLEISYSNLPADFNNYKIVLISDIHLGSLKKSKKLLQKAKDQINSLDPDIILFTGDLVNNFSNEIIGWENTFNQINYKKRSYSILGNHDYGDYTTWNNENDKNKNFDGIIEAHKNLGYTLLRNENTIIKSGSDSIFLIGVENWGHPPFPQYANLKTAMKNIPEKSFKILMTHDPAHWESHIKEKTDIDLTLSGHTHGLQWGIKTAGIPFSLAYFIRQNWGGLYQSGNTYLYVNTGLGLVGIRWRLDMPAEITCITLKGIQVD